MADEVIEVISSPTPVVEIIDGPTQVVEVHFARGEPGPPGPPGAAGSGYVYTQSTPLATWTIPHAFNRIPSVSIYLNSGEEVMTDVVASSTTVSVTFPSPTAGIAVLT